jgi:hypothetical protein
MECIKQSLEAKYPPGKSRIDLLVPKSNKGFASYDGVKVGGMRIVEEIEEFIKVNSQPSNGVQKVYTKISFVGYSLGGLWSRYAIGLLLQKGLLKTPDNSDGKLEPVVFTTFASPHAGTSFHQNTLRSNVSNAIGKSILGQSGMDLFLQPVAVGKNNKDPRPMLEQLADPDGVFYKALAAFKHRMLFSNTINDRTVPFYTAYISVRDPFKQHGYTHVVHKPHPDLDPTSVSSNSDEELESLVTTSYTETYAEVDLFQSTYKVPDNHSKSKNMRWEEFQFHIALIFFSPLLLTVFIPVSSISSLISYHRIRVYEMQYKENKSKTTDVTKHKRRRDSISEGVAEITGHAVDDFFGTRNPEQESISDADETDDNAKDGDISDQETLCNVVDTPDLPDLELSPLVFKIVDNLNQLEWEKHAVQFKRLHSHAEIVNRRNKPGQGEEVVRNWVKMIDAKIAVL